MPVPSHTQQASAAGGGGGIVQGYWQATRSRIKQEVNGTEVGGFAQPRPIVAPWQGFLRKQQACQVLCAAFHSAMVLLPLLRLQPEHSSCRLSRRLLRRCNRITGQSLNQHPP